MIEAKKIIPTKKNLRKFTQFQIELYRGNGCYVPPLISDEVKTLDPKENPASDFCEAQCFLAYEDGRPVGRVAAIINNAVNERSGEKSVRIGFLDFEANPAVSAALMQSTADWGRARGLTRVIGPLGFTDLDHEGMLVEGFDELSTMATIYNYPYYPEHMNLLGLERSADWVEMKVYIPDAIPEKHKRISAIIAQKYKLHIRKITSRKEIKETGIAHDIFRLINKAYTPLFNYSQMTERQIDQYVNMYVPVLDLRMVSIVENEQNEIVAVGISMASLSEALQKAKGKLLPFGWFHLLKALKWKRPKMLDLLLVAVRPDYQGKGVNALLFTDLIPVYQELGFEYAETNPELEMNDKVQNQWQYFKTEQHKRRRCFKGSL